MKFRIIGLMLLTTILSSTIESATAEFVTEVIKTGLDTPWSLNFAPDGRLFFTSRNTGKVSALDLKTRELKTFTGLPNIRDEGEAGLLGMAFDPNFAQNGFIYLCYSYSEGKDFNRLSRFTLKNNIFQSESILIDAMPGANIHNGCRVIIGPDGFLYASMGDAGQSSLAQDLNSKSGKIFRLNRDGSRPNDNPFGNLVWSFGHRNVQGLAFEPKTGLLWSTEHGPNVKDELNIIKKGQNYGWPKCMGTDPCNLANYQPAIKAYEEDSTIAISDLVFYQGKTFPWQDNILFVTLKTGRIYRLELSGQKIAQEEILIDNKFGRLRDIVVGPDGFIYFSTDNNANSQILRIKPKE